MSSPKWDQKGSLFGIPLKVEVFSNVICIPLGYQKGIWNGLSRKRVWNLKSCFFPRSGWLPRGNPSLSGITFQFLNVWKTSELTKKARLTEGKKSYPWGIINVKNICVNSPNRISKLWKMYTVKVKSFIKTSYLFILVLFLEFLLFTSSINHIWLANIVYL